MISFVINIVIFETFIVIMRLAYICFKFIYKNPLY